ncbi:MAG: TRAP transporter small permease subunit [Gammaproteobacteria bacterium]|jgi:TRAP-type mannitol/chloroaromatic compound transport system permease small subunit
MTSPEAGAQERVESHPLAGPLRQFSELTGAVISWLTLPMVVATFVIALLRYAFALNWIWMQELVVWMHALVFMLAAAYTLNRDEHVRVDIFYSQFSTRQRAWVELIGSLVFLLPLSIMLIFMSFDYVATSWSIREGSPEVGGLPYPFVPAMKTLIPLAFVLVAIQGVAIILDAWVALRQSRSPDARD